MPPWRVARNRRCLGVLSAVFFYSSCEQRSRDCGQENFAQARAAEKDTNRCKVQNQTKSSRNENYGNKRINEKTTEDMAYEICVRASHWNKDAGK